MLLDRYDENKTMERNLADLLPENLYRVFNETDLDKRKAAIADLWDEDGIFIDPLGVHQGHEKLNAAVTALQHQFPGSVFRVTLRSRKTSALDAIPGSMDRPAGPLSKKASM